MGNQIIDYNGRRLILKIFGQGFDSPHLHLIIGGCVVRGSIIERLPVVNLFCYSVVCSEFSGIKN